MPPGNITEADRYFPEKKLAVFWRYPLDGTAALRLKLKIGRINEKLAAVGVKSVASTGAFNHQRPKSCG